MYPIFLPRPNCQISLTVFDRHPLEAGSTTCPCPVTMLTQHCPTQAKCHSVFRSHGYCSLPPRVCPWTAPTLIKVRGTPENTQKGLKNCVTSVSFQFPALNTLGHTSPSLTFKKPDTGDPRHTFQSSHTTHHACSDNSLAP